eukprot:GILJ01012727.1.p1 GENE.GILJ01012727.1~~GILJ01012727.1.p1  ORF type:complete len:222 (+),score=37.73 GILJ01012727.1:419-1084(+)
MANNVYLSTSVVRAVKYVRLFKGANSDKEIWKSLPKAKTQLALDANNLVIKSSGIDVERHRLDDSTIRVIYKKADATLFFVPSVHTRKFGLTFDSTYEADEVFDHLLKSSFRCKMDEKSTSMSQTQVSQFFQPSQQDDASQFTSPMDLDRTASQRASETQALQESQSIIPPLVKNHFAVESVGVDVIASFRGYLLGQDAELIEMVQQIKSKIDEVFATMTP